MEPSKYLHSFTWVIVVLLSTVWDVCSTSDYYVNFVCCSCFLLFVWAYHSFTTPESTSDLSLCSHVTHTKSTRLHLQNQQFYLHRTPFNQTKQRQNKIHQNHLRSPFRQSQLLLGWNKTLILPVRCGTAGREDRHQKKREKTACRTRIFWCLGEWRLNIDQKRVGHRRTD